MPTARARTLADRLARVLTALCIGAACAVSSAALAQPGPNGPPPSPGAEAPWASESAQQDGDGTLLIRTSWEPRDALGERRGTVTLQRRDAAGAPRGAALLVYDGPAALTTLAMREGTAGVALWRGGARPFVKLALVDLTAVDVTRALADRAQIGRAAVVARSGVRLVNLERRAPHRYQPLSAVITPDAVGDGFAVLYQEVGPTQDAEAHSMLAVVTRAGRPTTRVVPVPWSLAALGDGGDRYVLVVRYDGGSAETTRLCFVTLTREGRPEQHPWWGAPPDAVDEVQLVRTNAPPEAPRWVAVYRSGGTELGKIRAAPVDMSGTWGREAAPPRELGERSRTAPWTVRSDAGALTLL